MLLVQKSEKEAVAIIKTHFKIPKITEKQYLLIVLLLAFFLRIFLLFYLKSYKILSDDNFWHFGFESGRIARAIASGKGFSAPFSFGDKPTAWLAPVFPYFLALIFKIFGIYSQKSALVILTINSFFSSMTCLLIYYIGKISINLKVGILSSILFAIYPPAIWISVNTIWHTTFSTLLITILFLYILSIYQKLNNRKIMICGLLMGFTALTNPVIISFYPFLVLWLFQKSTIDTKKVMIYTIMLFITFLGVISPWLIRNYLVFDKFVFLKSPLGVELRLGNNHDADGSFDKRRALHPTILPREMSLFNDLGEIGYTEYCLKEAFSFIRDNPSKTLLLIVRKIYLFWCGGDLLDKDIWKGNIKIRYNLSILKKITYIIPLLFFIIGILYALKNRIDISLFLYLLLSYPLIYYIAHVNSRYRHPLEPFIVIIGAYGIYCCVKKTPLKIKKI